MQSCASASSGEKLRRSSPQATVMRPASVAAPVLGGVGGVVRPHGRCFPLARASSVRRFAVRQVSSFSCEDGTFWLSVQSHGTKLFRSPGRGTDLDAHRGRLPTEESLCPDHAAFQVMAALCGLAEALAQQGVISQRFSLAVRRVLDGNRRLVRAIGTEVPDSVAEPPDWACFCYLKSIERLTRQVEELREQQKRHQEWAQIPAAALGTELTPAKPQEVHVERVLNDIPTACRNALRSPQCEVSLASPRLSITGSACKLRDAMGTFGLPAPPTPPPTPPQPSEEDVLIPDGSAGQIAHMAVQTAQFFQANLLPRSNFGHVPTLKGPTASGPDPLATSKSTALAAQSITSRHITGAAEKLRSAATKGCLTRWGSLCLRDEPRSLRPQQCRTLECDAPGLQSAESIPPSPPKLAEKCSTRLRLADRLDLANAADSSCSGGSFRISLRLRFLLDSGETEYHPQPWSLPVADANRAPGTSTNSTTSSARSLKLSCKDSLDGTTAAPASVGEAPNRASQLVQHVAAQVTAKELAELRSFRNPPAVVCQVLEAVAVILGVPDARWSSMRKLLDNNLLTRLSVLNPLELTQSQQSRLQMLLQVPTFTDGSLLERCPAVASLARWCSVVGSTLNGEDKVDLGGLIVEPDLWQLNDVQLAKVEDLTVMRHGVGCVTFHGITDCRELVYCLPDVVVLNPGEVVIYPNQKARGSVV
eukprot:g20529.t1